MRPTTGFSTARGFFNRPGTRLMRGLCRRIVSASWRPWAALLAAIARYDRSAAVGRISMPVALFAAGRDEVPPPSVVSKLAHACRTPS
jgi:alpha-beta hydrolase superfamily lysophospholipase